MVVMLLLGIVGLLSIAYAMRPATSEDDPSPDEYSDEEREALLMTQLYRSEHLMRQKHIRSRNKDQDRI